MGWLHEVPSTDGAIPAEGHGAINPLAGCHCPSPVSRTHTHKSPLPSQQRGMSLHASEQRLEARTSQSRLHPGVAGDASMKSWAMGTSSDQPEAPRAGAEGCSQAGLGEMPSIPVAKEKMGLSIHPCHTTQRSPRNSTSARTGGRTLPLVMEHKLGINIIKSDYHGYNN